MANFKVKAIAYSMQPWPFIFIFLILDSRISREGASSNLGVGALGVSRKLADRNCTAVKPLKCTIKEVLSSPIIAPRHYVPLSQGRGRESAATILMDEELRKGNATSIDSL